MFAELVDRLIAEGGAISPKDCPGGDCRSGYRTSGHIGVTPFDYEVLKRVLEQMCEEAGVQLLYHTTLIGCEKQEDSLTCVYAATPNDLLLIRAKAFIDTTGTAALSAKAGAETMRGNDDGLLQTASTFFIIADVDKKALDDHMKTHTEMRERFFMERIEEGQKDGSFPCGTQKLRIYERPDGTWTVNMAQVDEQFNELDAEALTRAEIDQRAQIAKLFTFLKTKIPGLENIRLVTTASDIGIRESRRMVGKRIFSLEDIQKATKFEDRIAVCANSVDVHQKSGVHYIAHDRKNYYIPLSALLSKNVKNLLTAGKSLSADKYAFAAVRVMPPCVAMGEAAGICAALAAKQGISADRVDYKEVQKILLQRGAVL